MIKVSKKRNKRKQSPSYAERRKGLSSTINAMTRTCDFWRET